MQVCDFIRFELTIIKELNIVKYCKILFWFQYFIKNLFFIPKLWKVLSSSLNFVNNLETKIEMKKKINNLGMKKEIYYSLENKNELVNF